MDLLELYIIIIILYKIKLAEDTINYTYCRCIFSYNYYIGTSWESPRSNYFIDGSVTAILYNYIYKLYILIYLCHLPWADQRHC